MDIEQFTHQESDPWRWRRANLGDVPAIVAMAETFFQTEIDHIFTPDPARFARHLAIAIITQLNNPQEEFLIVAVSEDNQLRAYAWVSRGSYTTYAPEEMAEARFAHIDMNLPLRQRLALQVQIIQQWELWARVSGVPVLVSTSIREDQAGFMRLHREMGFTVRGSYAYKRIQAHTASKPTENSQEVPETGA